MDAYTEKHLQAWLDRTIPWNAQAERQALDKALHTLVQEHPDLISKNYSWPEMRAMIKRR